MARELVGVHTQLALQPTAAAVTPATRKVYWRDPVLISTPASTEDEEAAIGVADNTMDVLFGPEQAGGSFAMAVNSSELVEPLLMCMDGTTTPTQPSAGPDPTVYDWTFGIGTPKQATIEWRDALGGNWWQGKGYQISEFTIEGAADGARTNFSATLFGVARTLMDGTGGRPAAPAGGGILADRTYPAPVQGYETALALGAFGGLIGSGTDFTDLVTNWSITFAFNPERDYGANNSQNASSVNFGMFKVTGASFTFRAAPSQALVELINYGARTKRLVEFTFGNNTVISTTYKTQVLVSIPGIWTAVDLGASGAGARRYGMSYTAVRNATFGGMAKIRLRNTRNAASAWGNV